MTEVEMSALIMAIHTDDLSALPDDLPAEGDRLVSGSAGNAEAVFERALRPRQLDEYVGQSKARSQLEIFISATRARNEAEDMGRSCQASTARRQGASTLPAIRIVTSRISNSMAPGTRSA